MGSLPAGSRPARARFRSPLRFRYPESAEIRGHSDSDNATASGHSVFLGSGRWLIRVGKFKSKAAWAQTRANLNFLARALSQAAS